MADYYPLIARAIAGLDPSAPGESRRALYERARAALIAQLRSVQPPLSQIRNHPRAAVAGRGRAQGRIRGRPARPRGLAARRRRPRAAAMPSAAPMPRAAGRRGRPAAPPGLARRPRPPVAAAFAQRPSAARTGRPAAPAAQSAPRCAAAGARVRSRRSSDAGSAAAAAPASGQAAPRRGPDNGAPRCRSRRACAASATSPPTPTISAAPRRRPTAPREKPMPTCRRPRRNSTGSSRAWKIAAPIRSSPIPTTSRSRRPTATRRSRRRAAAAAALADRQRDREPKKRARAGAVFPFKSAIAVGIVLILVGAGDPVGQVGRDDGERPVQILARGGSAEGYVRAAVEAEDSRSRRPAVVVAIKSRRWRSAWCCMTRIRPIPRASNMSAR